MAPARASSSWHRVRTWGRRGIQDLGFGMTAFLLGRALLNALGEFNIYARVRVQSASRSSALRTRSQWTGHRLRVRIRASSISVRVYFRVSLGTFPSVG